MTNALAKVQKTRRSVIGESLADVTAGPQVAKIAGDPDKEKFAALEAQIAAAAATPATAETAPQTLIDPEQMPTADTQRTAKRRAYARQLARKGRASTILTSSDDALGGEA